MHKRLFRDEYEAEQHEAAIAALCERFPQDRDFIRRQYEKLLEPLILDASIRTYLPIFVSRQLTGQLRSRH